MVVDKILQFIRIKIIKALLRVNEDFLPLQADFLFRYGSGTEMVEDEQMEHRNRKIL